MVSEEFQIVVKKPLAELERELRLRFGIEKNPLDSSFIEDNSVVFVFGRAGPERSGVGDLLSYTEGRQAAKDRPKPHPHTRLEAGGYDHQFPRPTGSDLPTFS